MDVGAAVLTAVAVTELADQRPVVVSITTLKGESGGCGASRNLVPRTNSLTAGEGLNPDNRSLA